MLLSLRSSVRRLLKEPTASGSSLRQFPVKQTIMLNINCYHETYRLTLEQAGSEHLTFQVESLQEPKIPDGLWKGLETVLLHI